MEKNMNKIFGVTIIKSPLAQSKLCLPNNAQKKLCTNFEYYYLINGADPMVESLYSSVNRR